MRIRSVLLALLALVFGPAVALCQTPQTYSLTTKGGVGGAIVYKVDRDGSKVSVEKTVPKSPYGPGTHEHWIFDLIAHKMWIVDLEGGPCVVTTYTSSYVSSVADPIGGAEELRAALAQQKQVFLRSETVNGIATKLYEFTDPQTKEKMKISFDEKYNFPVKTVYIIDGKEEVADQITSLSYTKPPASLFVPPQNCKVQAGETSATGGHVESEISAGVSAEVNMADGKVVQQSVQKPTDVTPAAPAGTAEVEISGGVAVPAHYTGPAPAVFGFTFQVKASGPVKADWVLVNEAGAVMETGKLVFPAAATRPLRIRVKVPTSNNQRWEGSAHLEVIIGERRISSPTIKISADSKAK